MVLDSQTTHIYLADTLENQYNEFFTSLNVILQQSKVPMERIQGTADIWARDDMPSYSSPIQRAAILHYPNPSFLPVFLPSNASFHTHCTMRSG